MASPEDARKAVEALNGKPLDGRNLTVEVSQPKPGGSARPAGAGGQGGARGGQGGSGGPGGHRGPPRPDRW
jgi:RNA recognition motif-containing protein